MSVYASHVKLSSAMYDVISAAADGSGLTPDPELDTYYLMDASVVVLPRLIDEAARMHALSVAVASSGQNGDIAAIEINRLDAMVDERSGVLTGDAAKVAGAHPDAKAKLDRQPWPRRWSNCVAWPPTAQAAAARKRPTSCWPLATRPSRPGKPCRPT